MLDWKTILTLLVTVSLALAGYIAKYLNDIKTAQRKDRLERVNRQLKEFYGPLYALSYASDKAWREAFRAQYRPHGSFWSGAPPPTPSEEVAWRLWMTEVFMPLNVQMERLIIGNADLLDEPEIPECLLVVCAHVSAYKAVLARWETGDYSEQWTP